MNKTRRTVHLFIAILTTFVMLILGVIPPVHAATLVVTTLADSGSGSLRDVITNAAQGDKVVIAVTGTITLTTGSIFIDNVNMQIVGPGANLLTINGNSTSRIFVITQAMTISGVTFQNGRMSGTGIDGSAGAIFFAPAAPSSNLVLNNVAFVGNQAGATVSWGGGALYNYNGTVTLTNCAFSGNTANLNGGAIYNDGALSITNCTFNSNSATTRAGGAIYNSSGMVTITNSTLTNNSAPSGAGGGVFNYPFGRIRFSNSIVAGNTSPIGPNYAGAIDSQGYNLIQDRTGSYGYIGSDLANGTNPNLGSFQLNGGQTNSQVPNLGSAAINAIPSANGCGQSVTTDQRGAARPQGVACDVGAVETGVTPGSPIARRKDTIGFYRPSTVSGQGSMFYMRTTLTSGNTDINAQFGPQDGIARQPVLGDWDNDGQDTLGVFGSFAGQNQFILINNITGGAATYIFPITGGLVTDKPVSGRWDNTMTADGVGLFRLSNGMVYLKKTLASGAPDYTVSVPNPGCSVIVGDWNGNGIDGISQRCDASSRFYLSQELSGGVIPAPYTNLVFGVSTDIGIAGDWLGTGVSSVGLYRPASPNIYLSLYTAGDNSLLSLSITPNGSVPQAGDIVFTAKVGAPGAVPPPSESINPPFQILVPSNDGTDFVAPADGSGAE